MGGISIMQMLVIIMLIMQVVFMWKIFAKAGFAPVLSLLTVIPVIGLFALGYVACSKWKVEKQ